MEIFDKIGKFAKTAADKTGDMVEVTRLNAKIGTMQSEIVDLKTRIGAWWWPKYEAGEPYPPELRETVDGIKTRLTSIASLETEIRNIRGGEPRPSPPNATACPGCGATLPAGAKFCGQCGTGL